MPTCPLPFGIQDESMPTWPSRQDVTYVVFIQVSSVTVWHSCMGRYVCVHMRTCVYGVCV